MDRSPQPGPSRRRKSSSPRPGPFSRRRTSSSSSSSSELDEDMKHEIFHKNEEIDEMQEMENKFFGTNISQKEFDNKDEKSSNNQALEDEKKKSQKFDDEDEQKIKFHCETCDMDEWCHYYGNNPPFATKIKFLEDCYVMRDPFSPPPYKGKSNPEYFLVLGSNCSVCKKTVCKDSECSFFYGKNYCIKCAKDNLKNFPVEVQTKIKKLLVS